MATQKQIEASRANGAKSHGPITPEGKFRSARNAIRHGLLSNVVVLRNESREAFQEVFQMYLRRFGPVDDVELGYVEEMVASHWRYHRSLAIEKELIESGMANLPPGGDEVNRLTNSSTDPACGPKLTTLHYHQARLQRVHSRALRDLILLRSAVPQQDFYLEFEPKNPPGFNKTIEVEPKEPEVEL